MKHAYLIIAHKCDEVFYTLLHMLDNERNDIFIHMDKKNKQFDPKELQLEKSRIYFPQKRIKVEWGGYSLIEAELLLLHKAVSIDSYLYYHLLSGEDLPIKTQKYIYEFFLENKGKEFVSFGRKHFNEHKRVQFYYFWQEMIGKSQEETLWTKVNKHSLAIQEKLGIKRGNGIRFQKGAQWFSITNELARYVLEKRKWIKKTFKYTFCCDEIFLQTLIINSEFKDKLYNKNFNDENDIKSDSIMRLIDWRRGNPYCYRIDDFEKLCDSDMLFARKFQANVDLQICYALAQVYGNT